MLLSVLSIVGCLSPALALETEEETAPAMEQEWDEDGWDGDWESYWEEQRREEKKALGMSNPDGINVSLNGVYLDLKGAEPVVPDEEDVDWLDIDFTALPLRATLEAMDAKVEYQDGAITAALADGRTLTAALDSETLEVVQGDKITTVKMNGKPYVDEHGVTYLPGSALAEALGLGLSYDMYYDTVHLTDWDALAAELDSHFTYINEILAATAAAVDREKNYAGTGTMTIAGTPYGDTKHSTSTISIQADTLQSAACTSMDARIRTDLDDLRDTVLSGVPEEAWEELEQWNNSRISMILNREEGVIYYKGADLYGMDLPEDAWLRMEQTAGSGAELLPDPRPMTMGTLLTQGQSDYSYGQSPWEETMGSAPPPSAWRWTTRTSPRPPPAAPRPIRPKSIC